VEACHIRHPLHQVDVSAQEGRGGQVCRKQHLGLALLDASGQTNDGLHAQMDTHKRID
jgi:hypothetical protein